MRRALAALFVSLTLIAAGCSSTSEKDAAPKDDAVETIDGTSSAAPGAKTATNAGGKRGGATASGTIARRTTKSASRGASASAPGVATTSGGPPIKIGYVIADTAGVAAISGSTSSAFANPEENSNAADAEMHALVRWANRTGGVGGRKIQAQGITLQATSTAEERMQACITFTEDMKVKAVIDHSLMLTEDLYKCFAQHKTTLVGVASSDRSFLSTVRPYIATTWASFDRNGRAMVDGLNRAKYFKGAKVGVVLADEPVINRVYNRNILPALKNIGVKPADVARISGSTSDASQIAPASANAVLRFKNQGITHVLMVAHILIYLAFTNAAETQNYHPRYGYGDFYAITGVAAFYGSPSQNRNSLGVSTCVGCISSTDEPLDPAADIDRNDPDITPGLRRCMDILSKETKKNYYKGNSGRSIAYPYYCDHFMLWLNASRRVGAKYAPSGWGTGLAALGKSYSPSVNHDNVFSPGRFDGASTYRVGKYSEASKVFVKITGWLPLAG